MSFSQRTRNCGELRASDASGTVTLNGWAHRVRNLGGLCFIDLRDRTGLIQLMLDPEKHPNASEIKSEFCLSVTGRVIEREAGAKNANLPTGDVEIIVDSYEVLNTCGVLPFPLSDEAQMQKVNEELRVKHRYLDLRRPDMYKRMAIRAAAVRKVREYLDGQGFLEIETPIFTKSTPEGARDYVVPYRLDPGKFYALPQSPQQYKQLLMVGGLERYYQIAKCFRDEAQRADRQPEFTQVDLEMSFPTQEDILQLMEGVTRKSVGELISEFKLDKEPLGEFVRMTYDESMRLYGSDKPDLRFALQVFEVTDLVKDCEFSVFKNAAEAGNTIRGIRFPKASGLSRKEVGELEQIAKDYGAKGMASLAWLPVGVEAEGAVELPDGRKIKSSIAKFFKVEELAAILDRAQAEEGDLLCFIADIWSVSCEALSRLRTHIGGVNGYRDPRKLSFCFIVDFPLVEYNADEDRWEPMHHMFTMPKSEHLDILESDPGSVRADCYDIVCNGMEWGSGSIRIHRADIQSRIFDLIGFSKELARERFGHMLDAFSYGAPPHGGIAVGVDRMVMFLTDDENIREVMAFPKMGNGVDPMMDSPAIIDDRQWDELGLVVKPKPSA